MAGSGAIERAADNTEQSRLPNKERVTGMPSPNFNLTELLVRVENDRELLRDLVMIFKEEFPQHLQILRDAVESMNGARIAATAHTLRGMLSSLAAAPAAAAVARLEQLGRSGEMSGIHDCFAEFENTAKGLALELDAYLAEVCR